MTSKPYAEITNAEYAKIVQAKTTEAAFQAQVVALAKLCDWKTYHTHDSRRSDPGFPDLVCVRDDQLLFVELKAMKGRVSAAQEKWLAALEMTGARVYTWRPCDWALIEEALL